MKIAVQLPDNSRCIQQFKSTDSLLSVLKHVAEKKLVMSDLCVYSSLFIVIVVSFFFYADILLSLALYITTNEQ